MAAATKMNFSPEALRARFKELTAQVSRIEALSAPRREERDAYARQTAATIKAFDAEIAKIEADKYDLEMERAAVVRALGGRTGEPLKAE